MRVFVACVLADVRQYRLDGDYVTARRLLEMLRGDR